MSYNWIKPGAKYRVVGNRCGHKFHIGEVVTYTGISHNGRYNQFTDGKADWFLAEDEVELIDDNTLVVGGKYTSKNGHKWECIAVRGDRAWMAIPSDSGPHGAAYVFKTDGTNVSQGGAEWNIAFPPREKWIDTRFSVGVSNHSAPDGTDNYVASIRFKLVDGKPDWSTATVTG